MQRTFFRMQFRNYEANINFSAKIWDKFLNFLKNVEKYCTVLHFLLFIIFQNFHNNMPVILKFVVCTNLSDNRSGIIISRFIYTFWHKQLLTSQFLMLLAYYRIMISFSLCYDYLLFELQKYLNVAMIDTSEKWPLLDWRENKIFEIIYYKLWNILRVFFAKVLNRYQDKGRN